MKLTSSQNADKSKPKQYPPIYSAASSIETFLHFLPITTPNSISCLTSVSASGIFLNYQHQWFFKFSITITYDYIFSIGNIWTDRLKEHHWCIRFVEIRRITKGTTIMYYVIPIKFNLIIPIIQSRTDNLSADLGKILHFRVCGQTPNQNTI